MHLIGTQDINKKLDLKKEVGIAMKSKETSKYLVWQLNHIEILSYINDV